jgi:dienelactone hydrolase
MRAKVHSHGTRRQWGPALALIVAALLLIGCGAATTTTTTGPAVTLPAVTLPGSQLVAMASELVGQLARNDFAAATRRFNDTMKRALPEGSLRDAWSALIKQAGAFERQTGTRTEVIDGYQVVLVTAQFALARLVVKVVFDAEGRVSGLFFLPESAAATYASPSYVDTRAFGEREVTVGSGEWALPGTLTVPKATGPLPAVVLVHGSGPNDRDETIGPNKPFKDLAQGLASQGIVVLRYEKRTKFYQQRMAGLSETITVQEETVDDAVAAVALLRQAPEVDPDRVFVLGHSLGGMLAPRILQRQPGAAGMIVVAGFSCPFEDLILEQARYLTSLSATPSPEDQAALKSLEAQVARVKDPGLSTSIPSKDLPLGVPAAYWLDLRAYNQVETARALEKPALFLQGGRDYQVTEANLEGWKSGLGGRPNVRFILYPDLNHLFMAGEGKGTPSEYNLPGNVAAQVITDIAGWVKEPTGSR